MTLLSKPSDSGISQRLFIVRLAAGVLLVNLFVSALVVFSLHQSRQHYKDRVEVQVQNLSQALELTIAGIIDKADVALLAVVDEAEKQISRGGIDEQEMNAYIARQHERIKELDGIRMSSEQGYVAYGTGVLPGALADITDRDYFLQARDNPKADLFIAKPIFGRVAKKWVLNLSRRVNRPDGTFAAAAWGSLSIDYLLKLFSSFDIGKQGSISLRDGELAIVARYTEHQGAVSAVGDKTITNEFRRQIAANPDNGTYTAYAVLDNIERTFSYHRVSRYPLYIIIGRSTSDYLAEWWHDAAKILALEAVFILGTLMSAWLVFRSWKEKQQAQEELYRYHEHLEELVKERTTELEAFNYSVSHDLRRPLTNINAYCQAILELWGSKLDVTCREYIQGAHEETLQMSRLIETLLEFSRMTDRELQRESVDLSAVAQEVVMGLKMGEPDRTVTFRCADGVRVNGDPVLLRMVMGNLLSNAWKFTGKQEEAVIEFGVKDVEGKPACFVRDNGAGFDMADAENLFVPFRRLPGADDYRGHGIGLATVARIIKRHGGRVWADGEPGKGATFYFWV